MADSTADAARHVLALGHPPDATRSAISDLVVPAVLLRAGRTDWTELVHVYTAHGPTVAFSSRDLRSPGIATATRIARAAGFETVVRSPGGRMVAYDHGAVVIDHLTRGAGRLAVGRSTFADNATRHADVLRALGVDAHVGEVDGEYCPGEHSVNVGGHAKVIGSAQRITGTGALFSTVVQVVVPGRVRDVIAAVSEALGYPLRPSSITGIADHAPLTTDDVAAALVADYRRRPAMQEGQLAPDVTAHAARAATSETTAEPFGVDGWTRANPLPDA